jgi:hypothetical protein
MARLTLPGHFAVTSRWRRIQTPSWFFPGTFSPQVHPSGSTENTDETGMLDASIRADSLAPDDAEPARARDGNAFRTITKEVTDGTGSFDFYQ